MEPEPQPRFLSWRLFTTAISWPTQCGKAAPITRLSRSSTLNRARCFRIAFRKASVPELHSLLMAADFITLIANSTIRTLTIELLSGIGLAQSNHKMRDVLCRRRAQPVPRNSQFPEAKLLAYTVFFTGKPPGTSGSCPGDVIRASSGQAPNPRSKAALSPRFLYVVNWWLTQTSQLQTSASFGLM